jgi:hypothetical protein
MPVRKTPMPTALKTAVFRAVGVGGIGVWKTVITERLHDSYQGEIGTDK